MTIENKGTISYDDKEINSNVVQTVVVLPLTIKKSVDKSEASIGDIITYTVVISNPNSNTINHVEFKDAYDKDKVTYVDDSFKVDDEHVQPQKTDPIEYLIQHVKGLDKVTISFQVKIKKQDEEHD